MNKRLLTAALIAACGTCAISMAAFAQQTTSNPDSSQSSPATTAQAAAKKKAESKHAVPPLDSNLCIRETGSHIPAPKGQCLPVAGNSYTRKDILRTGATNIGQALQMLDPSVTVGGGGTRQ